MKLPRYCSSIGALPLSPAAACLPAERLEVDAELLTDLLGRVGSTDWSIELSQLLIRELRLVGVTG